MKSLLQIRHSWTHGLLPNSERRQRYDMTGNIKKREKKLRWKECVPLYLMAVPGLIYMICNNYMPMFGILLAFKKLDVTKGILGSPWHGFKNFEFLFKTKSTFQIIRNTVQCPVYNFGNCDCCGIGDIFKRNPQQNRVKDLPDHYPAPLYYQLGHCQLPGICISGK